MIGSSSFKRAYTTALRLISYRPRSEQEMQDRLVLRFSKHVVSDVIDALKREGKIDDASFANLWRRSRDYLNPRSSSIMIHELVSRGVTKQIAQEACSSVVDEDNAYSAGSKAARQLATLDFPVFKRRLWGRLKRRGFSDAIALRTIHRLWAEQNKLRDR